MSNKRFTNFTGQKRVLITSKTRLKRTEEENSIDFAVPLFILHYIQTFGSGQKGMMYFCLIINLASNTHGLEHGTIFLTAKQHMVSYHSYYIHHYTSESLQSPNLSLYAKCLSRVGNETTI